MDIPLKFKLEIGESNLDKMCSGSWPRVNKLVEAYTQMLDRRSFPSTEALNYPSESYLRVFSKRNMRRKAPIMTRSFIEIRKDTDFVNSKWGSTSEYSEDSRKTNFLDVDEGCHSDYSSISPACSFYSKSNDKMSSSYNGTKSPSPEEMNSLSILRSDRRFSHDSAVDLDSSCTTPGINTNEFFSRNPYSNKSKTLSKSLSDPVTNDVLDGHSRNNNNSRLSRSEYTHQWNQQSNSQKTREFASTSSYKHHDPPAVVISDYSSCDSSTKSNVALADAVCMDDTCVNFNCKERRSCLATEPLNDFGLSVATVCPRKVSECSTCSSVSTVDMSSDSYLSLDIDIAGFPSRKNSCCSSCSGFSTASEDWAPTTPLVDVLEDVTESLIEAKVEEAPAEPRRKTSNWRKVKNVVQWTPFIQTYKRHKYPWVQLAGHQGNFKAGERQGTILKKLCPSEQKALDTLMTDRLCPFVPKYYGSVEGTDGEQFLELQDLLSDFSAPCVMDIKMGVRTYLEEELAKAREKPKLRKDMYEKMIQIDPLAPSEPEHRAQAVTKPRYMVWRETISSTATLGFRIEGVKKADGSSSKDFKTTRSAGQVLTSLRNFMLGYDHAPELYMKRLREIRATLDTSTFFKSHELIGSSLLFVHNEDSAVVWLIDFAKSVPLPPNVCTSHLLPWSEGSHEDGYLLGLDNLIDLMLQLMNEINLRKGLALKMRTAKDWERSETPTKETPKTDAENDADSYSQSENSRDSQSAIDSEPLNIQENDSATTGDDVYSGNNQEIHSETLISQDIHSVSFNIKEDDSESSNCKETYSEPADNKDNDLETVDVGNNVLENEDIQECDSKAVDHDYSEIIDCKDNELKTVSNGDICSEAVNDDDNKYSTTNTKSIIALMASKNVEIDVADSSSETSLEKDANLNCISNIVNRLESNTEVNSPLDDKGSDQMNDNQTELNQNFTNTDQELYIHDTYESSINSNTYSCEESNNLDTNVNLEESFKYNKIEKSSIVQNNVSEVVNNSNGDESLLESSKKSGDIRKLVSLNCDTNSIS